MKTPTSVLTSLLTTTFIVAALQPVADARVSNELQLDRPSVTRNASVDIFGEKDRKAALKEAINEGDMTAILHYARPDELTKALRILYGPDTDGEARQLPKGTSVAGYQARIQIHLGAKPQQLEMTFPGDPSRAPIKAIGSGGTGIRSNLLKQKCFSIDNASTIASGPGGDMKYPTFFRGKRRGAEGTSGWELPGTMTYAVHGLAVSTGYMKKLGGPASHGCFRVSNEDAKTIQEAVRSIGASNTIVCVD